MEREQLIAQVRQATGIRLSAADPVLAVVAMNEILLDQALAALDRQVRAQVDRVTTASTQAVADAKREAELLLSEGGAWAETRIRDAGEAAAAIVLAQLRQETAKAERASRMAIRAAWAMAFAGLLVLCGLGGMVLAGVAHG